MVLSTVDRWMVRDLPAPVHLLCTLFDDPAWQRSLTHTVVMAVSEEGVADPATIGLLLGVDEQRGVHVLTLAREPRWIDARFVAVPHPLRIVELTALQELLRERGLSQGVQQLHRVVFGKPATLPADATRLHDLVTKPLGAHCAALAQHPALAFPVTDGAAVCVVRDRGALCEARYQLQTGDLRWFDPDGQARPLAEVGPIAFSEGVRMACAIAGGALDPARPSTGA